MSRVLCAILLAIGQATANRGSTFINENTSLRIFYHNNLNSTDDINHESFLLLDAVSKHQAAAACSAQNESLLPSSFLSTHHQDVESSLAYLEYSGYPSQAFFVADGVLAIHGSSGQFFVSKGRHWSGRLPVLCTQSGNGSSNVDASVASHSNTYVGSRTKKAFSFLGVPFADPPARFEYSHVYSAKQQTIQATQYPAQCAQASSGSEDCLYLNIFTPYIPKQGSTTGLKPVMFWIHGGGFTGGNGQSDGSNLASREDVVFVSIQYRLSTLGFLAVPGTDTKGNYGIGDQITALQWVRENIASFGGDPNKITIMGQSAGAGSVRVLLGSPPAIGSFRGAIAQSNLGGGVSLGLTSDYSTTYSSYLTIQQSYDQSQALFAEAGCNKTTVQESVACLRGVPALQLVELPTVARYVVQDGTLVVTEQLIVSERNASTAHVPVMFGVMADDGASVIQYPTSPPTSEAAGLESILYISNSYAQDVINSGLFPKPDTGNFTLDVFNVSSRLYTDVGFRCVDQATVYAGVLSQAFPAAYFYQFDRAIDAYDPNNVGNPPVAPGYPLGNPALPYFKVHSGDVEYTMGSVPASHFREPEDLYFTQLVAGYWAAFARNLDPNPPRRYLEARGYESTLRVTEQSGPWKPVGKGSREGPIQRLNWPPHVSSYLELDQCSFLNYSLDYYVHGNRG